MNRKISLYLNDILEYMDTAIGFVEGMSSKQFAADKKTFNAVLRSIDVIGEAMKKIPNDIRTQYPGIPWKEMTVMSDKVIFFYFEIDTETIWHVIKDRIPSLRPMVEEALHDLEKQGR